MSFLNHLRPEIEKIAEECGTDYKTACEILTGFFGVLYDLMSDPRIPQIKLGHFGTFTASAGMIRRSILMSISAYRRNPTAETKSLLVDKITRLWKVRNRLILANDGISDGFNWAYKLSRRFLRVYRMQVLGEQHGKYYTAHGFRRKYAKIEKEKANDKRRRRVKNTNNIKI